MDVVYRTLVKINVLGFGRFGEVYGEQKVVGRMQTNCLNSQLEYKIV